MAAAEDRSTVVAKLEQAGFSDLSKQIKGL
jgi:hypothetical protein